MVGLPAEDTEWRLDFGKWSTFSKDLEGLVADLLESDPPVGITFTLTKVVVVDKREDCRICGKKLIDDIELNAHCSLIVNHSGSCKMEF